MTGKSVVSNPTAASKICYAHRLIIVELMYFMYNDYYLYNLIIDVRATEQLHNENEEEVKGDDRCSTCEVLKAESKILGTV